MFSYQILPVDGGIISLAGVDSVESSEIRFPYKEFTHKNINSIKLKKF